MQDYSNSETSGNIERETHRATVWTKVGAWLGFMVLVLAITIVVVWIFFWPSPAQYYSAQIVTPQVAPSGQTLASGYPGAVIMSVHVSSPLDPECLISTQYFIEYSDGSIAKLPGMRLTTQGELKSAIYAAAVPKFSKPGPAKFYVREAFSCGFKAQVVETPHMAFTVLPLAVLGNDN